MLKLVRAVLLVLPFLGALIVRADEKPLRLDPSQPMTKYAIASWRDTSGLPVDSVPALAQTRDGYLWAGTEHGLVRFDGVRFTTFNTANTPELRSNEIFTLFVSSDGLLWIGTRGGGAVTYDGTSFRRVPIRYRYIGAFAESADGAVWIGAPGGVVRAFGGRYTVFEKNQGYPGGYLLAMAGDADGVYIAMPSGVIRVGDGRSRVWSTAEGLSGGTVTALTWTDGGLLAGDQNGNLYRLRGDRFQRTLRLESGHAISSIHEGAAGSLWLSTIGGGLVRYHNGVVDRLAERDGLTSDSINLVIEDHEGSMWAGTTGGGLVQIKAARLTTIEPRQPLSGEWVLSLSQARDGSVWFGTNGAGVNRLEGESLTRVAVPQGLLQEVITAIGEDSEGGIWVGSNGGLQRVAGGRVVKTMTAADGLEGRRALAITASARGGVWVSTEKACTTCPRAAAPPVSPRRTESRPDTSSPFVRQVTGHCGWEDPVRSSMSAIGR